MSFRTSSRIRTAPVDYWANNKVNYGTDGSFLSVSSICTGWEDITQKSKSVLQSFEKPKQPKTIKKNFNIKSITTIQEDKSQTPLKSKSKKFISSITDEEKSILKSKRSISTNGQSLIKYNLRCSFSSSVAPTLNRSRLAAVTKKIERSHINTRKRKDDSSVTFSEHINDDTHLNRKKSPLQNSRSLKNMKAIKKSKAIESKTESSKSGKSDDDNSCKVVEDNRNRKTCANNTRSMNRKEQELVIVEQQWSSPPVSTVENDVIEILNVDLTRLQSPLKKCDFNDLFVELLQSGPDGEVYIGKVVEERKDIVVVAITKPKFYYSSKVPRNIGVCLLHGYGSLQYDIKGVTYTTELVQYKTTCLNDVDLITVNKLKDPSIYLVLFDRNGDNPDPGVE